MTTTKRLLKLKAASAEAWDARLAALDAYDDAAANAALDDANDAWVDYLLAADASDAALSAYRAALDKELK